MLQFSSKEDSPKAKLGGALKEVTGGAVKNTFLEFKAAPEHDFFPEMEDAALLPPRLYGRRARTPDPLRHSSIEQWDQESIPSKEAPRDRSPAAPARGDRAGGARRWAGD